MLERPNGIARGLYNRLAADSRFSGKQILSEAQWCLNTRISEGGHSASQLVCGSNTANLFGWDKKDEDLFVAQATSPSGEFAQQRKLRA